MYVFAQFDSLIYALNILVKVWPNSKNRPIKYDLRHHKEIKINQYVKEIWHLGTKTQ